MNDTVRNRPPCPTAPADSRHRRTERVTPFTRVRWLRACAPSLPSGGCAPWPCPHGDMLTCPGWDKRSCRWISHDRCTCGAPVLRSHRRPDRHNGVGALQENSSSGPFQRGQNGPHECGSRVASPHPFRVQWTSDKICHCHSRPCRRGIDMHSTPERSPAQGLPPN